MAGLASVFGGAGVVAARRASDFSPSGVEDPALVLAAAMLVCSMTLTIAVARDLIRRRTARQTMMS